MKPLAAAPDAMTLALVIPVWNDPGGVRRLVRAAAATGAFDEAVVVDDGSDPPLPDLGAAAPALPVRQLRLEGRGGAGRARNRGLGLVRASHVLFFDSDDLLHEGLPGLVRGLAADPEARLADITFFRHEDTRFADGAMPADRAQWDALRPVPAPASFALTRDEVLGMSRTVAYPWNKVFRTAFLRLAGVRCGETPVHNDIELHWTALVRAGSVRASHAVGAVHVVREGGTRLTNRGGPERLAVVDALAPVIAALREAPERTAFAAPFLGFAMDVLDWAEGRIAPELVPQLRAAAKRLMLAGEARALWRLAALRAPEAGERLVAWAMRP